MLTTSQAVAAIVVMALCTFLTRAAPFLLFGRGGQAPKVVLYLGKVLPPAIIAMLIVYCLKDVNLVRTANWLPQLLCAGTVVGLHLWKKNNLLSIFGSTVLYMILVQTIFAG